MPYGRKRSLDFIRAQIIALRQNGLSVSKTAKRLRISVGCVKKWQRRYNAVGEVKDKSRAGRPSVLSNRAIKIISSIKYKRNNSVRKTAAKLKQRSIRGSPSTVWRQLRYGQKWRALHRRKAPHIKRDHRLKRLQFASTHQHLTPRDWDNFLFTDECPFHLFSSVNTKNDVVWGSQTEEVPDCPRVTHSASVMVWGGMTSRALTRLHIVKKGKTVNQKYYITKILQGEVLLAINRRADHDDIDKRKLVRNRRNLVFVQDGAKPHTSNEAQHWCKQNLPNFIAKDDWPPCSPDLNPIENVWSILKDRVYKEPIPKNMCALRRRLQVAWKSIAPATLRNLVHSLPGRMEKTLIKDGGPIGY